MPCAKRSKNRRGETDSAGKEGVTYPTLILRAIRVWGPHVLIRMAVEAGLGDDLPKVYFGNSVCNACYDLMASPRVVAFLEELSRDPAFQRKAAYARVYYLKETEMVASLGLKG